jgi:biopolymer transport protein ExbD
VYRANLPALTAFNADINVTPMIDVLLVLMIVFMLAQIKALMLMNVTLPAQLEATGPSTPAIVLELRSDGGYSLNGTAVDPGDLAARIGEVFIGRPRSVLFIKSAPARSYREVIEAVDVAKGAGVAIVSFMPKT